MCCWNELEEDRRVDGQVPSGADGVHANERAQRDFVSRTTRRERENTSDKEGEVERPSVGVET